MRSLKPFLSSYGAESGLHYELAGKRCESSRENSYYLLFYVLTICYIRKTQCATEEKVRNSLATWRYLAENSYSDKKSILNRIRLRKVSFLHAV
ncbi:hypothetical protein LEP1GSC047_2274 [Leptospira inadai serovar Lyme str. 10]|uniref:Uncharacterized protein n=2 Tax=Leptospira inadai serovar Lyme TaxID=293084 RepID=V6HE10_9LEPT|nr:hypothetical protein LEP1GSC047_2274 [Leptospira inadai serovar Lyme str. 10]PNV72251.1 hypothetical protein BES34_019870 [Leptospira inadai serovar Lyme]